MIDLKYRNLYMVKFPLGDDHDDSIFVVADCVRDVANAFPTASEVSMWKWEAVVLPEGELEEPEADLTTRCLELKHFLGDQLGTTAAIKLWREETGCDEVAAAESIKRLM